MNTTIKEIFDSYLPISVLIDKYLKPTEHDTNKRAEVSTPYKLRYDMLNKVPNNVFNNYSKVFEPCCGKGGFLIDIVSRFMNGLKNMILNGNDRYKYILENLLYFSDINEQNINICKLLLDPYNQYKLNYYIGNTLKLDIKKVFNIDKFDLIICNPPYQNGQKNNGNCLWHKFVLYCFNYVNNNGYMCFVHPSGWRKPQINSNYQNLFNLMVKENHMIYLEMHNIKDGYKTFNCGTRYDWYVIQYVNSKHKLLTEIIDEIGIKHEINLNKYDFLPNYNFDLIDKLLHKNIFEKCIITRGNMRSDSNIINKDLSDIYKYRVIHAINIDKVRMLYSSIPSNNHYMRKVIFSRGSVYNCFIDDIGEYSCSEYSCGLLYDNIDEAIKIKKCLDSKAFKAILNTCNWSLYGIDWRLFTYFRKDFYNFIDY